MPSTTRWASCVPSAPRPLREDGEAVGNADQLLEEDFLADELIRTA